jgi:hypothetical protein
MKSFSAMVLVEVAVRSIGRAEAMIKLFIYTTAEASISYEVTSI